MTEESIQNTFRQMVAEETKSPASEVDIDASFHALGLDSVTGVFVMERLEREFNISLTPLAFWDFPTIRMFSSHIKDKIDGK